MSTEKHGSMKSHASWIVALVVGLVVGVAGARMAGLGTGSGKAVDVPAGWVKESDLPPGTLAGLSEQQKRNVLRGITERYGARPQPARPPPPQEDPRAVYRVPLEDSPVKGPADALVTIVEFSDFECPFCKRVGPTLKQIETSYGGKVRFAFKHNPLPFHPKALPSAMIAEEARAQGGSAKFWAAHDKLFDLSPALDRPELERAAQELGLDLDAVRRALDGNRHQARIQRDQALARSLGAGGTPTFFINGRKVIGAQPFEAFKPVIEEEIQKAQAMVKAGTPAREVYARIVEKGASTPVMLPGAPPQPSQAPPPPPPVASAIPLRPDDPALGSPKAKVTLVVFSDFQCPFCARVEPTLKQLQDLYKNDLRVVWKNQPLSMHPQAMPAALAAEAAREQGKFWAMHDLLFQNQPQLGADRYEQWARQAGLDLRRYKAALESPRAKARVEEDVKLATSVGANGTPTSFVNCRQIVGALPLDAFQRMVDEEIKKADDLLKKGARLGPKFYDRICDENVKAIRTAAAPGALAGAVAAAAVPVRPDDPIAGNPGAPVTLVEFSDFQCPFCGRVVPTVKQVEQAYASRVRVVWKHQPLAMHANALPAAIAAEAARQQGRFWQMHDKLFANQQALDPQSLERYAAEVGLDLPRFRAAQQDPKLRARVEEDQALAARLGIGATPTFVVNGEKLVGAQPFEKFKEVIDAQLQKLAQK